MWSESNHTTEDRRETVDTSDSSRLAMYRALERLALCKAQTAASEHLRESYLNIAKGWATLSAHIERVGERAALASVLYETKHGVSRNADGR
jgi:hypothetical protein